MFEALKNAFGSKSKNEAAIMKTANAIRVRSENPEASTLEDAVSTVITNITVETKRAALREDASAGKTPAEIEHLVPSVLLGMVLTERMWGIFEEKFDGGKVATYVALRHCLDNPRKDSMAVFAESAGKYSVLRKEFEAEGEEFNKELMTTIVSSFATAETDSIVDTFKPLYARIRQREGEIAAPFPAGA